MNTILITRFMKVIFIMEKSKVEESFLGIMERFMMGNGNKTKKKEVEFGKVLIVYRMLENGDQILLKDLES